MVIAPGPVTHIGLIINSLLFLLKQERAGFCINMGATGL